MVLSGCLQLHNCLAPGPPNPCMYDTDDCKGVPPGGSCRLLCKLPYIGGSPKLVCPQGVETEGRGTPEKRIGPWKSYAFGSESPSDSLFLMGFQGLLMASGDRSLKLSKSLSTLSVDLGPGNTDPKYVMPPGGALCMCLAHARNWVDPFCSCSEPLEVPVGFDKDGRGWGS